MGKGFPCCCGIDCLHCDEDTAPPNIKVTISGMAGGSICDGSECGAFDGDYIVPFTTATGSDAAGGECLWDDCFEVPDSCSNMLNGSGLFCVAFALVRPSGFPGWKLRVRIGNVAGNYIEFLDATNRWVDTAPTCFSEAPFTVPLAAAQPTFYCDATGATVTVDLP